MSHTRVGNPDSGVSGGAAPAGMHVVLLGDSTLDNIVWVRSAADTVTHHLRTLLGPDATVTNYAADAFNSHDVVKGAVPTLSGRAHDATNEPFPTDHTGYFYPLQALRHLHERTPVTHVVVSVGGNDVREILGSMHRLPDAIKQLHDNYAAILESVVAVAPRTNVVVVLQYKPCAKPDQDLYGVYRAMDMLPGPGAAMDKLERLMEHAYAPVFALARERGAAIVDLTRTFDPYDAELFVAQIEPSAKGSRVIAGLIAHALREHPFQGGAQTVQTAAGAVTDDRRSAPTSTFYWMDLHSGDMRSEPNVEGGVWRISA